ncbi:hypothetical protein [Cognatishimia sp. F0-27]|uniref:hypothetical protein n=1 Tax=Cognatishimia sp. F0-27 TaxID=2816855 RepID=UPI001D0C118C|nr:hypothetical protein [Cognatishimia sp. F0-27]
MTFDGALYTIAITRPEGWERAAVFSIRFSGGAALEISTTRHQIDGKTVTVTDRGFGNVLDGLQFNDTATAILGEQTVTVDLSGAARPVQAFRDCPSDAAV